MLFSNLNYHQINFFLFNFDCHLFFRTGAKMDFIADLELKDFSHHLLGHFHCLNSLLLIFKETFMFVLELTMA
jgi:hypothetical protein